MKFTQARRYHVVCVARSQQQQKIRQIRQDMYTAIRKAYETCHKNKDLPECQVAWSDVEELSRALYNLKTSESKRLDFCRDNPGDPECRMYDL